MGEDWVLPDPDERLLTYAELRAAVDDLREGRCDPHVTRDWIHLQALRTIAATSDDVVSHWIARVALETYMEDVTDSA